MVIARAYSTKKKKHRRHVRAMSNASLLLSASVSFSCLLSPPLHRTFSSRAHTLSRLTLLDSETTGYDAAGKEAKAYWWVVSVSLAGRISSIDLGWV
jgi:hypothetical protein